MGRKMSCFWTEIRQVFWGGTEPAGQVVGNAGADEEVVSELGGLVVGPRPGHGRGERW